MAVAPATVQLFNDANMLQHDVRNYFDWGRLSMNSRFFSLLNLAGNNVKSTDQTAVLINDKADFVSSVTSIAVSKTLVIPATNAISTDWLDLDTFLGVSGVNAAMQVNDELHIFGSYSGTATTKGEADVLIVEQHPATKYVKFKTLYTNSTAASSENATITFTIDSSGVYPTTIQKSALDEYKGQARDGFVINPENYFNFMQVKRASAEQGLIEKLQKGLYDKDLAYQMLMLYDRRMAEINRDMLYSAVAKPALTSTAAVAQGSSIAMKHDGGMNSNSGKMGGLPKYLSLKDCSASKAVTQLDAAGTLTFSNLRKFFAKFDQGGNEKWVVLSAEFEAEIEDAAKAERGFQNQGVDYAFPNSAFTARTWKIGDFTLRTVIDRNLSKGTPIMKATAAATKAVNDQRFMYVIDPRHIKVTYLTMDGNGILVPKVVPVGQTNNLWAEKMELISGCTLEIDNLGAHGAYGILHA